jgi:hypothetical protein
MKQSKYFLSGISVGRLGRTELGWTEMRWDWMGGRCYGFESHQLNRLSSFSYFHIFIFSYFHIFIFSYFHLSSYHISRFQSRIFIYSHVHIFSKNTAHMNSMHSIRKIFHITEGGMKRSMYFLTGINVGRLGWTGMRWDGIGWVAGVAGSIHINLTLFFLFLIFLFSYFHLFIFSFFHLSSYHISIFLYFYILDSHVRIFSKMHRAWTVCNSPGRYFIEQNGYEGIQVFFEGYQCG